MLTAQPIPTAPNGTTLPLLANVSIVPPEAANFNGSFFAAEIVISEPSEAFPDPIIYVSNRNLGPDFDERGDTIAIFEYTALTGNSTEEEVPPASTSVSESVSVSATPTEAPTTTSGLAGPVVATLIAADTSAVAKRMVKYHARRRPAHENARRQYGYDYPEPASSPSPSASSGSSNAGSGTTITLLSSYTPTAASPAVTGTETASGTATGPVVPTATPTAATLRLTNQVFTGLRQIRSFAIGKADENGGDEFLIAGANLDGGVAVFKRTEGGRNLELVTRNTELQSRTSFVFL